MKIVHVSHFFYFTTVYLHDDNRKQDKIYFIHDNFVLFIIKG